MRGLAVLRVHDVEHARVVLMQVGAVVLSMRLAWQAACATLSCLDALAFAAQQHPTMHEAIMCLS